MKIFSGLSDFQSQNRSEKKESRYVSIGNFDGVHLGHQSIIRSVVSKARELGGRSVILTFVPHPRTLLSDSKRVDLLMTYEERRNALRDLGVDELIEEPFTRDFSNQSAVEFLQFRFLGILKPVQVEVGYDFTFGKNREGSGLTLKELAGRFGVTVLVHEAKKIRDQVVSSSSIRKFLESGDMEAVREFLGNPFFYEGIVEKGESRGRKLGYPTANISLAALVVDGKKLAARGVYVTEAIIGNTAYRSVSNLGVRPTFRDAIEAPNLETHVLSTDCRQEIDLYGSKLRVHFLKMIRPEKKFNSGDELREQIAKDVKFATQYRVN